jgi:uncharacterized phage-associated protein
MVSMMRQIAFRFSARKARAAMHWMLQQVPVLDLHTALKTCYFADKDHLNKHGRPILGATYRAMKFGPVPLEVYEMAKGEPYWLAELAADRYPWDLKGYKLHLASNDDPDLDVLSQSDVQALEAGFSRSRRMSFNERTAATHGKDWQAAELGIIKYEDMLDDTPEKPERVNYLREASRFMRL